MGRRKLIEDEDLLARVREIVVREGTAVSSHKIAKEIGISSSVLFQRFGSKEGLLFAAMVPPAPDLVALLGAGEAQGDTCAQLEQVLLQLITYFRQLLPVMLPLAGDPAFDFEAFHRAHPGSPLGTLMQELMATWEHKRLAGEIDCPAVGPLVLGLLAIAHSLVMFERVGAHGGAFDSGTVRELAQLLWRGLAPKAPG
ncbi:MAG: TetR/AcrR family transcriptional regulator [Myxococcota bacterium]